MAGNRIKGITIEIAGDTTKLDKALNEVDTQLKKTQGSLKEVDRLLKMDPGNTELLAQKQRLLADALEKSKKRAETLNEAMSHANEELSRDIKFKEKYSPLLKSLDEAASAYENLKDKKADMDKQMELGEISTEQYDAWNSKMKESQENLKDLRKQVADAKAEMGGPMMDQSQFDTLQRELIETEINIRQIEDAANEASSGLDGLSGASGGLSGGLGGLAGIAGGVAIAIGQKLVEAAIAAAEWLWNLDEATEEYREAMGKLNTAFETAGFSTETAKNAYEGFYRILGDTDTATEASQLLAQLVEKEEDVAKWTDIAAGVYGTFGDALPIEGLIEAANETAKTGEVTGVLADALNWVGKSEDEFNEKLALMYNNADRARFIMTELGIAYEDAADSFYKNNETLIETREVQMQLDETQAALGESVASLKNKFFELFGPALIEGMKLASVALEGVAWVIDKIGQTLDWLGQKIKDVIGFFQELFGVSNQASNVSLPEGGSRSRNALAEPYSLRAATAENLPYLAQGTVTRPNSPFMAVVGDNPTEPEIISPLSTIEQAVRNVVGVGGAQSSVPRSANITLVLNGSVIGRVFAPLVDGYHEIQGVDLMKT